MNDGQQPLEDKKKFLVITPESFAAMMNCFTDHEEMVVFANVLDLLTEELDFQIGLSARLDVELTDLLRMKRICLFCKFVRDNYELVRQLVSNLNVTEVDEDQFNEMNGGI